MHTALYSFQSRDVYENKQKRAITPTYDFVALF